MDQINNEVYHYHFPALWWIHALLWLISILKKCVINEKILFFAQEEMWIEPKNETLYKFSDFCRMGTFIDNTHMKL